MRLDYSLQFLRAYAKAPLQIQKLFDRKAIFLLKNFRHPSLRIKKFSEAEDIWQARVTGNWRFYFKISGDIYYLLNISPHPK